MPQNEDRNRRNQNQADERGWPRADEARSGSQGSPNTGGKGGPNAGHPDKDREFNAGANPRDRDEREARHPERAGDMNRPNQRSERRPNET